MIGKRVAIIIKGDGAETTNVTILDKVRDIRTVTVPAQGRYTSTVEYFIVDKYVVSDDAGKVFTIYTHQLKHLI